MQRSIILLPFIFASCARATEPEMAERSRIFDYRGQEITVSWTPRTSDLVIIPGEGEATLTHPADMALDTAEVQSLMSQATGCNVRKDVIGFRKSGDKDTITLPVDC